MSEGKRKCQGVDLSRQTEPCRSGLEPENDKTAFYCAVCADGRKQEGNYRRHLLEHLHKASHETALAKLELDAVFGSQAFPNLMWSQDFENLAYLGVEEAENLCKQMEEYLRCQR